MKKRKMSLGKIVCTLALSGIIASSMATPVLSYSERSVREYSASSIETVNNSLHPGVSVNGEKITYKLPSVPSKYISYYKTMPITINGTRLKDNGAIINNVYCVPVRAFFEALGARVTYSSSSRTLTVVYNGLYLTATDGGYVIFANDRPILNFAPNTIMTNGKMYASLEGLLKITGLSATRSPEAISVSGRFSPLKPASGYYREDEVFWLARIITAEARGESLLGQIAVGNVIMNRVASPLYPNTIYGVIFDRKYGVQFSPVLDGSIYNTPTYTATLAAKIILEGTRLSEDSLFFLNPITAQSGWISKNREYLYTIGGHDFYR